MYNVHSYIKPYLYLSVYLGTFLTSFLFIHMTFNNTTNYDSNRYDKNVRYLPKPFRTRKIIDCQEKEVKNHRGPITQNHPFNFV